MLFCLGSPKRMFLRVGSLENVLLFKDLTCTRRYFLRVWSTKMLRIITNTRQTMILAMQEFLMHALEGVKDTMPSQTNSTSSPRYLWRIFL